jgi:hypothetical protein
MYTLPQEQDLLNTIFFSQELSAFDGFESRHHFVEWFLYGVDGMLLQ